MLEIGGRLLPQQAMTKKRNTKAESNEPLSAVEAAHLAEIKRETGIEPSLSLLREWIQRIAHHEAAHVVARNFTGHEAAHFVFVTIFPGGGFWGGCVQIAPLAKSLLRVIPSH